MKGLLPLVVIGFVLLSQSGASKPGTLNYAIKMVKPGWIGRTREGAQGSGQWEFRYPDGHVEIVSDDGVVHPGYTWKD